MDRLKLFWFVWFLDIKFYCTRIRIWENENPGKAMSERKLFHSKQFLFVGILGSFALFSIIVRLPGFQSWFAHLYETWNKLLNLSLFYFLINKSDIAYYLFS